MPWVAAEHRPEPAHTFSAASIVRFHETHGAIRATGNPAIAGHTGMAGIRGFAAPACAGCAFWLARESPRTQAGRCDDVRGFTAANEPTPPAQRRGFAAPANERPAVGRLLT